MKTGKYRYELTRVSPEDAIKCDLKKCTICGNLCAEVWEQEEEAEYVIDRRITYGGYHRGWTYYGCRNHVGHKECLLSVRKPDNTAE